ncbi:GNAT family N-acetyltransferase [Yoonia litorea]|uniref:Ribosomal-protein-alanine N-acetyltransferase n=1 Tax=Yoonia litorea TaxID=1123755 RepID=A0A1I6L7W0_9RHOB|nr:GNAT family N-acetyltransferase [Yoonia litorea]SFR99330.1 ribosomal-protein-alanine N-acetyltransferase [Yoonia litorea]
MTPESLAETHALAFADARGWQADEFAALLKHPGTFAAGSTDSFVLIRVIGDEAEIMTVATHPQKQRRGLARKALVDAERRASDRGATTIFLEVAEDNPPARALYDASGYREVGRRADYYTRKNSAAVAALVLRKDIASR